MDRNFLCSYYSSTTSVRKLYTEILSPRKRNKIFHCRIMRIVAFTLVVCATKFPLDLGATRP